MWRKNLINFFLILLVIVIQTSFLNRFDFFLLRFDLIVITLVFFVILFDFPKTLFFAVLSGLILDVYSGLPFGIFLLVMFFTALSLEFLFLNFFTNRSFYSLFFLGLIGVIFYNFFFLLIAGSAHLLSLTAISIKADYWWGVFWQLIDSAIALGLVFYLINRFSKLFKPTFIQH